MATVAQQRTTIGYADFSGGDCNFVIGCTPESEGCAHCYARAIYAHYGKEDEFALVRFYQEKLKRLYRGRFEPGDKPFRRGPGSRPIVFVVDMGDLFHLTVTDEQIKMAYDVMRLRGDVDWVFTTKRARRLYDWTLTYLPEGWPPNVWAGVSIENTKRALERIHYLQWTKTRGIRWLSGEPMLESIPLLPSLLEGIGWVVCGAESGRHRRPFNRAWGLDLYQRCAALNIPFFGKQDSDTRPGKPLYLGDHGIVHQWPGMEQAT